MPLQQHSLPLRRLHPAHPRAVNNPLRAKLELQTEQSNTLYSELQKPNLTYILSSLVILSEASLVGFGRLVFSLFSKPQDIAAHLSITPVNLRCTGLVSYGGFDLVTESDAQISAVLFTLAHCTGGDGSAHRTSQWGSPPAPGRRSIAAGSVWSSQAPLSTLWLSMFELPVCRLSWLEVTSLTISEVKNRFLQPSPPAGFLPDRVSLPRARATVPPPRNQPLRAGHRVTGCQLLMQHHPGRADESSSWDDI